MIHFSVKAQSSARDKYFQRQTALTLMGFILFIALCVVTAFYVTILVGVWLYPVGYLRRERRDTEVCVIDHIPLDRFLLSGDCCCVIVHESVGFDSN